MSHGRPPSPDKMHPSTRFQRTSSTIGLLDTYPKTPQSSDRDHRTTPPYPYQQTRHLHLQLPHWTRKVGPRPGLRHPQHIQPSHQLGSHGRWRNRLRQRSNTIWTILQLNRISTRPIKRTIQLGSSRMDNIPPSAQHQLQQQERRMAKLPPTPNRRQPRTRSRAPPRPHDKAADKAIPSRKPFPRAKPWWNADITKGQRHMNSALRTWKQEKSAPMWNQYKANRNIYFQSIWTAKEQHWKTFLSNTHGKEVFTALRYTKPRKCEWTPSEEQ